MPRLLSLHLIVGPLLLHSACSSPETADSGATGGLMTSGGSTNPSGGSAPTTGGAPASGGSAMPSGGSTPASGGFQEPGAGGSTGGSGGSSSGGTQSSGGSSSAGGAEASGGQSGTGGSSGGPYSFMALGDSITGTTCYTQYLAQAFADAASPEVNMVGGVTNNQSCPGTGNTKSEGHGGYLVTYLTTNSPPQSGKGTLAELGQWSRARPDIVLIHFGTNDVWNGIAPANIVSAEEFVIAEFRKENPNILFFVSKIIPMNPSGCPDCSNRVVALNALLTEAWASGISTATSPVRIVDQWTGFDPAQDTGDGVHPNPAGGAKMAERAYETIAPLLNGP